MAGGGKSGLGKMFQNKRSDQENRAKEMQKRSDEMRETIDTILKSMGKRKQRREDRALKNRAQRRANSK